MSEAFTMEVYATLPFLGAPIPLNLLVAFIKRALANAYSMTKFVDG